ncbi:site-specific integrase [Oceanicola sp. 502str15]|uniref:site-specific integrase n=1 Tax=Oceanicola sp. 502str15 TaxID=2696061 RepID=UPI002094AF65|nr:site-specific integrase [Oceanicola sp. 502str15]MCO6382694.1 tyrosine-type recombinase/integrase [Oceanicola sp. 502str15]
MSAKRFEPPHGEVRLSKRSIEALPVVGREYYIRDLEVPKLHIKVSAAGKKTFVLRYNSTFSRGRKYKLGDFPDLSIQAARRLAARTLLEVANGNDPSEVRRRNRSNITLGEVGERFMEEHAQLHLRPSTVASYWQILRANVFPRFGNRPLLSISKQDMQALQRDMQATRYAANRTLGLVGRLYNWAADNGLHPKGDNPTNGIKQYKEKLVERLLSTEEMRRVAEAIDWARANHPGREAALNAIVFMFFTACRRGEAFNIQWDHVDFERGLVHFYGAKTGDRDQPLTEDLRDWLLELRERAQTPHIFPGRSIGKPLTDIKKTWDLVRQRAGIPELRLHDIRHNVLSDIASETDVATAQAVGGHANMRSTMRYLHARKSTMNTALTQAGRRAASVFFDTGDT